MGELHKLEKTSQRPAPSKTSAVTPMVKPVAYRLTVGRNLPVLVQANSVIMNVDENGAIRTLLFSRLPQDEFSRLFLSGKHTSYIIRAIEVVGRVDIEVLESMPAKSRRKAT